MITKKQIKKVIIEEQPTFPLDDMDKIDAIFNIAEEKLNLQYNVYLRGSSSGSDYWLQCEFHSNRLSCGIIFDYDFTSYFEDEEELIDKIISTEEAVKKFIKKYNLS